MSGGGETTRPAPSAAPAGAPNGSEAGRIGLLAALGGYAAAVVLAGLALGVFGRVSGHPGHPASFGGEVADLVGEWIGFAGAALVAARTWQRRAGASPRLKETAEQLGLSFRWWDLPLGIAAGVGSQYLVAPAFEALLVPFVPHLFARIGGPAHELTSPAHTTGGLVVLGVLLCVGSPLFEELYFRGLLLRSLVALLGPLGRRAAGIGAVVSSALVFALVHFEALQLLGLFGFGLVLGALARRTGRLGPGIVAHVSFNAVTVVAIALAR